MFFTTSSTMKVVGLLLKRILLDKLNLLVLAWARLSLLRKIQEPMRMRIITLLSRSPYGVQCKKKRGGCSKVQYY
jgi:hypothetical protein